MERKSKAAMAAAISGPGMGLGMGRLCSEQLDISGGLGIPEQSERPRRGDILLFRIG